SLMAPASTALCTLSLHDALPICGADRLAVPCGPDTPFGARWYDTTPDTLLELLPVRAILTGNTAYPRGVNDGTLWSGVGIAGMRSEEHTSELQSRENLVCRLLLE